MRNRTRTRGLRALAVLAVVLSTPSLARAQERSYERAQERVPESLSPGMIGQPSSSDALPMAPVRGVETIRSPSDPARRELVPRQAEEDGRSRAAPDASGAATTPGAAAEPRALQAPRELTDFQLFAATSVGRILPIFGAELFASVAPGTYAPAVDAPPASDYVVGPGDELLIRGWGQVDIDVRATVSREGTISLPRVGVIPVSGTRYEDLPGRIRAAVSRYYRNFELSVSLGRLRSIQVFVVGHAQRPGLYTVNSLSTVMNVLFASGGPSQTGTMRRIEHRRADRLVGEFDLYDVLVKGDKSGDRQLLSGDVVFIPPLGPVAAVAGSVKTPAVFELRVPGTSLGDLLQYAGGLTTTAATQSISLERLEQKRGRVVEELEWSDAALATPMKDGDVVQLRRITPRFDNAVTIRGSVVTPMRTAWRPGLKVSDLIPDRDALVSSAYWARSAARAFDAGQQLTRRQGMEAQQEIQERVRTEVENLMDEVNWDYAVVERLDRERLEPKLVRFNLARAVIDRDPEHDLALEPGDIVTVFSQKDILTPAEKRTYFVRVEGELAVPGIYQVRPGETLRELIRRAGGLTGRAYLFGAEFNRESVRREQQARLDEIAVRAEQQLERSAAERLSRALTTEDTQAVRAQIEGQRAAIARLRLLRATGRMVLEVEPGARAVEDLPDLALEDGDRLYVPDQYSTVGVYGAVYNQSNLIYTPGRTLSDYLGLAGGPTRSADSASTYVLRADGSVFSRRQKGWFQSFGSRELMPNDNIVVPEDYAPTSWVKELRDWSQIFYQFGLGVAAINILRQ